MTITPDARSTGTAFRRALADTPLTVAGPFRIAASTPGLDDGVELWTPAVGDLILAFWGIVRVDYDVADGMLLLSPAAQGPREIGGVLQPVAETYAAVLATHQTEPRDGVDLRVGWASLTWAFVEVIEAAPVLAQPRVPGSTTGAMDICALVLPAASLAPGS